MKHNPLKNRLIGVAVFFGLFLLLFFVTLYNNQIIHGSEYRARSISSNATTETVGASRGLITDRNGKVLVSNALTYTLTFSRQSFEADSDLNEAIWRLIDLCRRNDAPWNDSLPLTPSAPYRLTAEATGDSFAAFCKKAKLSDSLDGAAL